MNAHLSRSQIEDFCRRKLAAADLLSVSDHIAECEACRSRVEGALNGTAAFFGLRSGVLGESAELSAIAAAPAHPAIDQIAEYVDGGLAGEELQAIRDHLTGCLQCAAAAADLNAFKDQAATELDREYRPEVSPALSLGLWHRLADFHPLSLLKTRAWSLGAALAAIFLLVIGGSVWRMLSKGETAASLVAPAATPANTPGGEPATVLVQLNDGQGRILLNRDGGLSGVDNLPPSYRQLLKEALIDQRLVRSPLLAGLSRQAGSLMGGDEQGNKFALSDPVGKVVFQDRPTFRWSRLDGAAGYVAEVYDEGFNLVAASPRLAGTSWAATRSLKRGGVYSWQVRAFKDGQEFISPRPPAPQATFRILDQARADELTQARGRYPSSHLLLGLLYGRAGLLDDAEREWLALQKANPDSAIVSNLLKTLSQNPAATH